MRHRYESLSHGKSQAITSVRASPTAWHLLPNRVCRLLRDLALPEGHGYSPAYIKGLLNLTFLPIWRQEPCRQVKRKHFEARDFAVFPQIHYYPAPRQPALRAHAAWQGPSVMLRSTRRTCRPQHLVVLTAEIYYNERI